MALATTSYPTWEDLAVVYKSVLQTETEKPSHVSIEDFEAWYSNPETYYDALDKITAFDVVSAHSPGNRSKALEWAAAMHEFNALPKPLKFGCPYRKSILLIDTGYLGLAPMGAELRGIKSSLLKEQDHFSLLETRARSGPTCVHVIVSGRLEVVAKSRVMTFV